MKSELNGLFLNEIIHIVLFLILLVLYINLTYEKKLDLKSSNNNFSLFILFFAIYIGLMLVWLPIREFHIEEQWTSGVLVILVFCASAAYSYVGCWLLSIVEVKNPVSDYTQKTIRFIPYFLFGCSCVIMLKFHNITMANIPILINYIILELLAVKYYRELGGLYVGVITMFIVPTLLLQAQEWWNYTPANIYVVLIIITIYCQMWIAEKEKYLEQQRNYALQNAELESIRTKLILSQMKPHFLFNTLATITYLCKKEPKAAAELSADFTTYLRDNIQALDSCELISFAKELEHIKAYLGIECVRFSNILQVKYDIAAMDFYLPVLTVEPLVENAIKHGIKEHGGSVTISTRELEACYQVIIKDDGVGFNVSKLETMDNNHVGLRSVKRRIELLGKGSLSIMSAIGAGTTAVLTLPKKYQ